MSSEKESDGSDWIVLSDDAKSDGASSAGACDKDMSILDWIPQQNNDDEDFDNISVLAEVNGTVDDANETLLHDETPAPAENFMTIKKWALVLLLAMSFLSTVTHRSMALKSAKLAQEDLIGYPLDVYHLNRIESNGGYDDDAAFLRMDLGKKVYAKGHSESVSSTKEQVALSLSTFNPTIWYDPYAYEQATSTKTSNRSHPSSPSSSSKDNHQKILSSNNSDDIISSAAANLARWLSFSQEKGQNHEAHPVAVAYNDIVIMNISSYNELLDRHIPRARQNLNDYPVAMSYSMILQLNSRIRSYKSLLTYQMPKPCDALKFAATTMDSALDYKVCLIYSGDASGNESPRHFRQLLGCKSAYPVGYSAHFANYDVMDFKIHGYKALLQRVRSYHRFCGRAVVNAYLKVINNNDSIASYKSWFLHQKTILTSKDYPVAYEDSKMISDVGNNYSSILNRKQEIDIERLKPLHWDQQDSIPTPTGLLRGVSYPSPRQRPSPIGSRRITEPPVSIIPAKCDLSFKIDSYEVLLNKNNEDNHSRPQASKEKSAPMPVPGHSSSKESLETNQSSVRAPARSTSSVKNDSHPKASQNSALFPPSCKKDNCKETKQDKHATNIPLPLGTGTKSYKDLMRNKEETKIRLSIGAGAKAEKDESQTKRRVSAPGHRGGRSITRRGPLPIGHVPEVAQPSRRLDSPSLSLGTDAKFEPTRSSVDYPCEAPRKTRRATSLKKATSCDDSPKKRPLSATHVNSGHGLAKSPRVAFTNQDDSIQSANGQKVSKVRGRGLKSIANVTPRPAPVGGQNAQMPDIRPAVRRSSRAPQLAMLCEPTNPCILGSVENSDEDLFYRRRKPDGKAMTFSWDSSQRFESIPTSRDFITNTSLEPQVGHPVVGHPVAMAYNYNRDDDEDSKINNLTDGGSNNENKAMTTSETTPSSSQFYFVPTVPPRWNAFEPERRPLIAPKHPSSSVETNLSTGSPMNRQRMSHVPPRMPITHPTTTGAILPSVTPLVDVFVPSRADPAEEGKDTVTKMSWFRYNKRPRRTPAVVQQQQKIPVVRSLTMADPDNHRMVPYSRKAILSENPVHHDIGHNRTSSNSTLDNNNNNSKNKQQHQFSLWSTTGSNRTIAKNGTRTSDNYKEWKRVIRNSAEWYNLFLARDRNKKEINKPVAMYRYENTKLQSKTPMLSVTSPSGTPDNVSSTIMAAVKVKQQIKGRRKGRVEQAWNSL